MCLPTVLGQHAVLGQVKGRFGTPKPLAWHAQNCTVIRAVSIHAETAQSPVEQLRMAIEAFNVRAKPSTRSTSATPVPIHPVGRPQQFKLECCSSYYARRTYMSTLVSFHECSVITPLLRQDMVRVKRTRDYVYPLPEEPVRSDSHSCSNISKSSS